MLRYKQIFNTEKIYPNKKTVKIYHKPIHVLVGHDGNKKRKKSKMQSTADISSLNRTKNNVRDIILCNKFTHFCTFTFKDFRDDIDVCKSRMHYWLKSQQKIHGNFDYIIVPEFHKDGKALHFHALLRGYKGKVTPAKNPRNNNLLYTQAKHLIFNLPGWRNGFSTASIIDADDSEGFEKVANYVTKYITKDMPTFPGKKRYWVSQSLVRPIKNQNINPDEYYSDSSAEHSETETSTKITIDNK